MSYWKETIDIAQDWQRCKQGEISISELVPIIVAKFHGVPKYLLDQLSGISDPDEFDDVWEQIYDWADAHRVWIAT